MTGESQLIHCRLHSKRMPPVILPPQSGDNAQGTPDCGADNPNSHDEHTGERFGQSQPAQLQMRKKIVRQSKNGSFSKIVSSWQLGDWKWSYNNVNCWRAFGNLSGEWYGADAPSSDVA
eukprot:CAMPEP_0194763960 /NCGR_PEP_ID=MMETSP0323_2-20130528/20797_1 /TAXON_ID=2866 ORGANISM="Crypthecodinium cohnii, Strain Seligo" /NCGR_SAMPLE_ID=MMETSP0323_2 /ASSEMBLY_ACC=CAM_ASM_000346 /LENGTH=118 /DNA_ID=CAMNT_0039690003 /DNA_START=36 /DNA_END=389 /DNA_ORIENTATION=+